MRITVNGEAREMPDGTTVTALLDALSVGRLGVAVEVNRELVPRSLQPGRTLAPGDTVEIVTLVGGG